MLINTLKYTKYIQDPVPFHTNTCLFRQERPSQFTKLHHYSKITEKKLDFCSLYRVISYLPDFFEFFDIHSLTLFWFKPGFPSCAHHPSP